MTANPSIPIRHCHVVEARHLDLHCCRLYLAKERSDEVSCSGFLLIGERSNRRTNRLVVSDARQIHDTLFGLAAPPTLNAPLGYREDFAPFLGHPEITHERRRKHSPVRVHALGNEVRVKGVTVVWVHRRVGAKPVGASPLKPDRATDRVKLEPTNPR